MGNTAVGTEGGSSAAAGTEDRDDSASQIDARDTTQHHTIMVVKIIIPWGMR
jgi:hypothetical protein